MDVHVFLGPRGVTDAADRLRLPAAVARVAGQAGVAGKVSGARVWASVGVEQLCTRCGGAHGRPRVVMPADCTSWGVSLSRAGTSVAVAISPHGEVGIDIESIEALSRRGVDDVAFTPSEITAFDRLAPFVAARARTRRWTVKEAVLKLTGEGLNVDPRDLVVGANGTLESWPGAPFPLSCLRLIEFGAGPGLVGTVAAVSAEPVRLTVHTECAQALGIARS